MKVIGTGSPAMLTLRLEECEIEVLCDELQHRRAVKAEAAAVAHERSAGQGAGAGTREVEDPHDELVVIAGVLDQLSGGGRPSDERSGGRAEIVGPTWLLGPSIRGATAEAAHRLLATLDRYRDERACTAEEMRAAVKTVTAWVETMVDYDYTENHGMDY